MPGYCRVQTSCSAGPRDLHWSNGFSSQEGAFSDEWGPRPGLGQRWVFHAPPSPRMPKGNLTLVLLVPDDDEEGDAGAKGIDGDGHLTQHACQLPTHSPHHLLVGPLIAGLGAVGQDDEATDDENQHALRAGTEQEGVGQAWQ